VPTVPDRAALRDPDPPYLEYSFYVHERPPVDAFAELVRAALSDGATPTGIWFYRGPDMRGRLVESQLPGWETKPETVARPAPSDVEALLDASDVLVIAVEIKNPTGVVPEAIERIGYCVPYSEGLAESASPQGCAG
jgi:hypothetical protein